MRHSVFALVSLVALSFAGGPVAAQDIASSKVIFERGQWSVSKLTTVEGDSYCIAQVLGEGSWVNLWIEADGATGIEFDADDWGYDITTETFLVTIDNGKSLNLSKPEFTDNRVYFALAYNKTNVNFFTNLRKGRDLYLNNKQGELIGKYPLDGSSASIDAMVACADKL